MQFNVNFLLDLDWEGEEITWEKLRRLLDDKWDYGLWRGAGSSADEARGTAVPCYREAIEALVSRYARDVGRKRADVWIDHTPGNLRRAGRLLERFPDARLVHLVRDGRGVASSIVSLPWGPHTVIDAARAWPEWLGFGLAHEMRHPGRMIRVHYEELVRRPAEVMERVCRRLNLESEDQMGTETDFRLPDYHRASHALVPRPPDASRAEAWKESLTRRQIEIFESLAGDLLTALGYELEFRGSARRPSRREKVLSRLRAVRRTPLRRLKRSFRIRRHVNAAQGTAPEAMAGGRTPDEASR